MDLIHSALFLLLLQLSSVAVEVNGQGDYKCTREIGVSETVKSASAHLTKGCLLKKKRITFDLVSMYLNDPNDAVVISISETAFINSHITLINAHKIASNKFSVPLQFTMSNSNMSGTSSLVFGSQDQKFKLPPHSHLRILHSQLTISAKGANTRIFTFHSLQLDTNSSMEISHNVITMENKGVNDMAVFHLPKDTEMIVSKGSSFILRDNEIDMNIHDSNEVTYQYVWLHSGDSPVTISENSIYTWLSNNINMVGYNIREELYQWVLHASESDLTISQTSKYTWAGNNITMTGYDLGGDLHQSVWGNVVNVLLTISEASIYMWARNIISMSAGFKLSNVEHDLYQYVWVTSSSITISSISQFLFESNRILLLARDYGSIDSSVMAVKGSSGGAISEGSSMAWKANCVGMVQKKADKRHVFTGIWSITDKSELMWAENYFTTVAEYQPNGGSELTEFVWGPTKGTAMTINTDSTLSIGSTHVNGNSATSATGSVLWSSSSSIHDTDVSQPAMDWVSSPAKDDSDSPIPHLDNSNLQQYMCVVLPDNPTTPIPSVTATTSNPTVKPATPNVTSTTKTAVKSATVIPSTISAFLITSGVFVYLSRW